MYILHDCTQSHIIHVPSVVKYKMLLYTPASTLLSFFVQNKEEFNMDDNFCLLGYNVVDILSCCSEFDEIMKALKWPFTSLSTAPPLSTTSDDYSRLENAFILLLKLQQLYLFN